LPLIQIMTKGISTQRILRETGKVLTFLLLILYATGSSHLELLHSFVHQHDVVVTHSEEQEKDPCHRMTYHNDADQDCDHDSHLIVPDKCQICHLAAHGDQIILPDVCFASRQFSSEHFNFYRSILDSYWAVISSSRAPPLFA
jgi:hypothetical protein